MNERLDRSTRLGPAWQALKWKLKYLVNSVSHVPPFAVLVKQPHRVFVCDAVRALGADTIALEVGCGRGANLYLLASRFGIRVAGVDLDRRIIEFARAELVARGVEGAEFAVASAVDLSSFADRSMDVVFADAVLIYVPPKHVRRALSEMLRVARRGIVLSAWHRDLPQGDPWTYDDGTWVYDYRRLLEGDRNIRVTAEPYPKETWPDARWSRFGAIVTVRKVNA